MNQEMKNWREEAVDAALRSSDHGATDTLLYQLRRHQPPGAVVVVNLDRTVLRRFLETETQSADSLLSGDYRGVGRDGELRPYMAWYAVRWQGVSVEMVFVPIPGNPQGDVLCLGDTPEELEPFVLALMDLATRPLGRALRYSAGWKAAPDLDREIGGVTWDDIVLPPALMAGLRDAVEGFYANRATFEALGFAWRRGILLIGPPGTGKTMVCKAVAAALPNLPFLYVRDIRQTAGTEPVRPIFDRARKLSPCILAFEDLDSFVNQANRAIFLNELDGFQNNNGLFIIASSNHPGQIDEALLKRPSRFDRVFHLGLPGPEERQAFCEKLLSRSSLADLLTSAVDVPALARQVAEGTEGFTPAYLKEVFLSAALQRVQVGATQLDAMFAKMVLAQVEELRAHLRQMRDPQALVEMEAPAPAMGLRRRGPLPSDQIKAIENR